MIQNKTCTWQLLPSCSKRTQDVMIDAEGQLEGGMQIRRGAPGSLVLAEESEGRGIGLLQMMIARRFTSLLLPTSTAVAVWSDTGQHSEEDMTWAASTHCPSVKITPLIFLDDESGAVCKHTPEDSHKVWVVALLSSASTVGAPSVCMLATLRRSTYMPPYTAAIRQYA